MEPQDAEPPESRDIKEVPYLNNSDLPNNRMQSPTNSNSTSSSSTEDMSISSEETSPSVANSRPRRSCCEKYNLRRSSLRVRVQAEEKKQSRQQQTQQQPKQQQPARQRKPKSRPPPLSKYRRRSANARERFRMAEINDAFEELKEVLPQDDLAAQSAAECKTSSKGSKCSSTKNASKSTKNQPTKVSVLRLAIDYIASLRNILGYEADSGKSSTSSSSSSTTSSSNGNVVNAGHLSDDLGSDAASTSAPSTSSCSGDEESLMSFEDMDMADSVDDLDFLASSLGADFSATLSAEDEMCLELVASVL